jgi:type II secretory pathway pseudopilin PulG
MKNTFPKHFGKAGFTLIEVVLALGVFFVSILALIGLLGPMLRSVDEIEKIDEITSVVNTLNAFLQGSAEIPLRGTGGVILKTKFNAIYEAISTTGGNEATIFVYRYYDDNDMIRLEIGFSESERDFVGPNSIVNKPDTNPANFNDAAGPIYRVVLTVSSVTPVALRSANRTDGIYTLIQDDVAGYTEGYLAFEARIFAEDPPGPTVAFDVKTTDGDYLSELNLREPDFSFNAAIVR